ncbi:MAG: ABC transporter permease subunit [Fibrobacterota bacterium]|nr:MAG: ABC transporter permease subunit [Fibrobacterota bacterium]
MKGFRYWSGWLLLGLIPLPVLVLLAWTARLSVVPTPEKFTWSSGESMLAMRLPGDSAADARRIRVLRSDGSPCWIGDWTNAVPQPDAWLVWRDDAAPVMGRLLGVVVAFGDTLRGANARKALLEMPDRIAEDEHRLERTRRDLSDPRGVEAEQRLQQFRTHQTHVVAVLDGSGTGTFSVPLVRIRHAESFGGGWTGDLTRSVSRLWFQIRSSPDTGSGGGIKGALLATGLVVLLAGLLGGIPALLLAVYFADQIDPGPAARWLRWASEGLSGVPGVVWGCVCAALLVSQGISFLAVFGWSFSVTGGVLWAGLTLGILSAPITFSRAMDAIDRVPRSSREIARSCGASRHQVLFLVVLPACKRGLTGAWLSGLARAGGETAPLLLVGAAGGLGASWHVGSGLPVWSGEFLHLGAMAYALPWPAVEAQFGHPLAFLSLSLVALGCMALEWGALHAEGSPR